MINVPETTERLGRQEDDIFIIDRAIGYDFSVKGEVTFIMFDGLGRPNPTPLVRRLNFWTSFFKRKLGHGVNVVVIRDGTRKMGEYTANYCGIPGVCDDFWGISNLLQEKLYLKGTTRRVVVVGDCGGAIPAILTSVTIPVDTLMLFTPFLRVVGACQEFEVPSMITFVARKHSIWVTENLTQFSRFFDLTEFLDKFLERPGARLDMHWATSVIGVDAMFRSAVEHLRSRPGCTITDHVLPPDVDAHLLEGHLVKTRKYFQLCAQHVKEQLCALNYVTADTNDFSP